MPKRLAIQLVNVIWYSTAFIIVLLAVALTTGRELFPQINLDNEKFFSYLSKRTGADIHVSGLRGQWTRLPPPPNAKEILVHSDTLDLRLENIRLDMDILRSIWRRTPVVDGLLLSNVHIRYFASGGATTPDEAAIEKRWQTINNILNKNIRVQNLFLELHTTNTGADETVRNFHVQDFRLEQTFDGKKIFLAMVDENDRQTLTATGNLRGNSLHDSEGIIYLKANGWPIHELFTSGGKTMDEHWQSLLEKPWLMDGEAWINWNGLDSATAITQLRMNATESTANQDLWPDALSTNITASWRDKGLSTIDIHSLDVEDRQSVFPLLKDLRMSGSNKQPGEWRLQTPALPLRPLMALNSYLPDGELKALFESLNPEGLLKNIDLDWNNKKPLAERMVLRANLADVSVSPWHGVPALTHVNGYLQSGIGYGFVDLDSRDGFSMFYPGVYHAPLDFQRANGRVQWHWKPEEKTVLVGSDFVSLSSEAGEARGNFWLRLPIKNAGFHSEMDLVIGLRNSQAKFRDRFLPYVLPENLLSWLKTSIGDATVPEAGFIYRGALTGYKPHSRTIQFFADVRNGDVQFDPDWPRVTGLDARLLVDDGKTLVQASAGQLLDTRIDTASITVSPQEPGLDISIDGRTQGPAGDALRILGETPLAKVIGPAMDNWRIPEGSLETAIRLQVPLSGSKTRASEDVRASLSNTALHMDDLRLSFNNINGEINYQNDKGLYSPAINATFFGKPLNLTIASQKTAKDLTINIKAKGSADTRDIANWSRLKPLQMMKGSLDFDAALSLGSEGGKNPQQIGKMQVTSNMQQAVVPLPKPFAKLVGEKKPLALSVDLFTGNRQDYQLEYNKQLSGALSIRNGEVFNGEMVLLGETAKQSDSAGPLVIRGTLPESDMREWLDLIAHYNKLPDQSENTGTVYPVLSFSISNALWKEYSFPGLQLSAKHENDAWRIDFDAGNAKGSAFFHDDNKMTDIAIKELRFQRPYPEKNIADDASVAELPVDFAEIPSLNVSIDHLFVNDMDVGAISTEIRNKGNSLHFENMLANGTGYRLRDGSGKNGSRLIWRKKADGSTESEFHGLLYMQGKQPALTQLGIDMFIRGESIYLYADLVWPGSPQHASVKNLSGYIYTSGKNGKYLQAQTNNAMRALGIVNIATWVRRLRLDFSDLNNEGISFDEYRGKLRFKDGIMELTEPLEVMSPSSTLVLDGKAMLEEEQLDLTLTATLPVGNNATWITALAGGLPAALGVYLVSKVFDNQIQNITSLTYTITGPMDDPDFAFQRIAAPKK